MAHRLKVRQSFRVWDGVWFYPLLKDTMAETGLQEVETYVSLRKNTVTQFIATSTIKDLCLSAKQRPGSRVTKWWWDQDGLDADDGSGGGMNRRGGGETDGMETETN